MLNGLIFQAMTLVMWKSSIRKAQRIWLNLPTMNTTAFIRDIATGEKTVERQTNEPVQVDNILIVETPHQTIDDAGRREIDLESGGDGFLIQRGKARHVQWQNKDGRI